MVESVSAYNKLEDLLRDLVDECRQYTKLGHVATYIPILSKADPNKIGICIHTIDNKEIAVGDVDDEFSIQSISKTISLIITYTLIKDMNIIKNTFGVEASANKFNSLIQLETLSDIPTNPMINSGAIACAGLLVDKISFDEFIDFARKLCDSDKIRLSEETYMSEKTTGFRNYAIAYLLKSKNIIKTDVEKTLDFYFKMCSLLVTARSLSRYGSVLANGGTAPWSKTSLIDYKTARRTKTLMQTCGMYDASGYFALDVGMPTKSGVGGGLLSIADNKCGIGVFSPSLDEKGNSVAGCRMLEILSRTLKLHNFDKDYSIIDRLL